MPKLKASRFRVQASNDGQCEVTFISELNRQFDVTFDAAGIASFVRQLQDLSKATEIRLSLHAAPQAHRLVELPASATDEIQPGSMGFGVSLGADYLHAIPYFLIPSHSGHDELSVAMPLADAKKLFADLGRVIALIEEHDGQSAKPQN